MLLPVLGVYHPLANRNCQSLVILCWVFRFAFCDHFQSFLVIFLMWNTGNIYHVIINWELHQIHLQWVFSKLLAFVYLLRFSVFPKFLFLSAKLSFDLHLYSECNIPKIINYITLILQRTNCTAFYMKQTVLGNKWLILELQQV